MNNEVEWKDCGDVWNGLAGRYGATIYDTGAEYMWEVIEYDQSGNYIEIIEHGDEPALDEAKRAVADAIDNALRATGEERGV